MRGGGQEAERAHDLAELAGPEKKKDRAEAVRAWDKEYVFRTMLGTPIEPRTTKVGYVDVAEGLQPEAMDKLGLLFEEPEG